VELAAEIMILFCFVPFHQLGFGISLMIAFRTLIWSCILDTKLLSQATIPSNAFSHGFQLRPVFTASGASLEKLEMLRSHIGFC
jgi:hypothetical protein